jgi:hypothetical protein
MSCIALATSIQQTYDRDRSTAVAASRSMTAMRLGGWPVVH